MRNLKEKIYFQIRMLVIDRFFKVFYILGNIAVTPLSLRDDAHFGRLLFLGGLL